MEVNYMFYDGHHGPTTRVALRGGSRGLRADAGKVYGLSPGDALDLLRLGQGWQRCTVLSATDLKKAKKAGAQLAPLGHAVGNLEVGTEFLVGSIPGGEA